MADTNNIEVVKMLPISSDPVKAEIELNQMIYEIQHNHATTVHEDLCGGIDPYKFLFAYNEIVGSPGDATARYGVAVIEGAADPVLTETRINDCFDAMRANEDVTTKFISISHPSEFIYIAFYKIGGSRDWPIVKIKTIVADPVQAGHYLGRSIETWRDDEAIFPYDKLMIDKNHLLLLCDDIITPTPTPEPTP